MTSLNPAAQTNDLPELELVSGQGRLECTDTGYLLTAGAGSDLICDPMSGNITDSAPVFGFSAPAADFTFSAKVTIDGPRTDYDAGALILFRDQTHWAKLCFEISPDREPMAVGVVTRGLSDDANGDVIESTSTYLRLSRINDAVAFHHSPDGTSWRFLRVFSWPERQGLRLGLVAQSPLGPEQSVRFEAISLTPTTLGNLRDHS